MLKRKNKKALSEQLEDSLYPDDYWLDKEDGQEVSEPLPDGENPVSGKLRKEPMVTGYEALERQRGVRRPKRKITRREKKALKQAQKYEAKLRKEQERADKKSEKREAKLAEKAEKEAIWEISSWITLAMALETLRQRGSRLAYILTTILKKSHLAMRAHCSKLRIN